MENVRDDRCLALEMAPVGSQPAPRCRKITIFYWRSVFSQATFLCVVKTAHAQFGTTT